MGIHLNAGWKSFEGGTNDMHLRSLQLWNTEWYTIQKSVLDYYTGTDITTFQPGPGISLDSLQIVPLVAPIVVLLLDPIVQTSRPSSLDPTEI